MKIDVDALKEAFVKAVEILCSKEGLAFIEVVQEGFTKASFKDGTEHPIGHVQPEEALWVPEEKLKTVDPITSYFENHSAKSRPPKVKTSVGKTNRN